MSIFCSSSTTSRRIVSKIELHHGYSFLYPRGTTQALSSRPRRELRRGSLLCTSFNAPGLEAWLFNSPSSASSNCRFHRPRGEQHCTFSTFQRPSVSSKLKHTRTADFRHQHIISTPVESGEQLNRTKEELMALVDQYSAQSYTDQLPLLELPSLHQPSNGPYLTVSDKVEDEWPPPHSAWPADPETKKKIAALCEALRDFSKDPQETYLLYRDLPSPRVPYLESKTRHKLLRHLSVVEKKNEQSMIRYLSVVDDMKRTAIPLNGAEWTSALSFVSRYVAKSTEIEVEAALQMWREMEHSAGVKANDAAFNVLYDVACKAGKFTLAEMIYKEMEARGLKFNRFHHVSRIHFCGLRGDGDGARAAYKALVEAGEMVDTVVLNAMIAALIQSHEASAAENVYERMKRMFMEDTNCRLPPRNFKKNREINRTLKKMAIIAKKDPSRREELQKKSIIAPDVHTYRILVTYFAVHTGELDKAARFLDEMKWFKIPLHGALFLALFKGFSHHGGVRYTQWSEGRLERVWESFIQGLDDEVEGLHISKWIVIWALKAFAKCSGKSRTMEIWEQFKERYQPGEADLDHIMRHLRTILDKDDTAPKRHDWLLGPTL